MLQFGSLYILNIWKSIGVILKMVQSKAQMLQPLFCPPDKHDHILTKCRVKNFRPRERGPPFHWCVKSGTVLMFVSTFPFVPQITPQKLKILTQEKSWLQRRGGSEQRDKRPQIGPKNDKRTQIGKMPIARRSSAGWLGERFDVNFSVCLLHAALPEILLPASSVQAAPARIGHRPNVLEEQFFCWIVDLSTSKQQLQALPL